MCFILFDYILEFSAPPHQLTKLVFLFDSYPYPKILYSLVWEARAFVLVH